MTTQTAIILTNILFGFMLVIGVFLLGRMRIRSLLRFFAMQSFCLAAVAAIAALAGQPHLFITAALVFVIKTVMIPLFMIRVMSKGQLPERLRSAVKPTSSMFLGVVMTLLAFFLTFSLIDTFGQNFFIIAVSLSLALMGLLMMMARKGLYGQIVGFLMMENGIFALGLALTGGMPLLVEIGVFFDVTVGAVIMALLSYRVGSESRATDTDALETLTD